MSLADTQTEQDRRLRLDLKRRLRLAGLESDLAAINDITVLRQLLDRELIYQQGQPVEVNIRDAWHPGTFFGYERPTGEDFRRLSVRFEGGSIHDLTPERVRPAEKAGGIDPNGGASSLWQRDLRRAIDGERVDGRMGDANPEAVAQAAETMRHTPGPWYADGATHRGRRYHQIEAVYPGFDLSDPSGLYTLAATDCRDDSVSEEEDAANALLLATAPELADALAVALSAIENLDFTVWELCGHDSESYRVATGAPSLAEAAREIVEALKKAGRS